MSRAEKIQHYISSTLKFFIGVLIIISTVRQEYFLAVVSSAVLILTFLPGMIERSFKINLPPEIDFILTLVLYLHYALGEFSGFYVRVWWWDLFLHGGNSLILGLIGFAFAYSLLITSRIKAKPLFVSLFVVSFSVLVGVIWEIFEFGMDNIFGLNMQKSGLMDTMSDLMVNVVGALVVGVAGFLYMKNPKPGLVQNMINHFAENHRMWKRT